jgi:hypothetical protein
VWFLTIKIQAAILLFNSTFKEKLTMKKSGLLLTVLLVTSLFPGMACNRGDDLRYKGWNRYTDKDDGYVILVPGDYLAEGESVPGLSGTRFYTPEKFVGELTPFVYFSILARDINQDLSTPGERAREMILMMTEGIWNNLELEESSATFHDFEAIEYKLKGKPFYSDFVLQATATYIERNGRSLLFIGAATERTFSQVAGTYRMMVESLKFP